MTIVSELDHCTLNLLSSDDFYYKAAFLGYAVAFSERKILNGIDYVDRTIFCSFEYCVEYYKNT